MAALGWLMSLAGKEQPGRLDEVIAGVRAAAPKARAIFTPSGIGSIFVSCATTTPALLKPAGRLSEAAPADPLALWAFLHAARGSQRFAGPAFHLSQCDRFAQPAGEA